MTIYVSTSPLSKDDISRIIPLMEKYRQYNHQKIQQGETAPYIAFRSICGYIIDGLNELMDTSEEPYFYLSSYLYRTIDEAITYFEPLLEEELKTADLQRTKEIKEELESFILLKTIEYDWGMASTSYHGPA